MSTSEHWQRVYETRAPNDVSWYAPHLRESLRLIQEVATLEARIIDVGAGASTLVDDLLDLGYCDVTMLDIAGEALAVARRRLGERGDRVKWLTADITTASLAENSFDLWHDRAVFHFLTHETDRQAYVRQVRKSVAAGGHLVLATFSLDGPTKCSGLDVMRYDAQSLAHELGPAFQLNAEIHTTHTTPSNKEQRFICCRFIKLS
jgi:2-polyprenyl-3-methyl-5-hydroxy-6-metoxy-1,4-benzoquinol methylase